MSPRRDFGREAVVGAIKAGSKRGQRRVSIARLAAETGLSERTVQRAIDRAVEAHELAHADVGGGSNVGCYRLINGTRTGPAPTLYSTLSEDDTPVVTTGVNRGAPPSSRPPSSRHPSPVVTTPVKLTPDVNRLTAVTGITGTFEALFPDAASPAAAPHAVDARASQRSARPPARKALARPRARRPLFDAIAACWLGDGVEPGKTAGSVVAMAEREVAGYGGTAEEVAARWAECCSRYDEPTPLALAKHWLALGRPMRTAQRSARAAAMSDAAGKAEQLRREGR